MRFKTFRTLLIAGLAVAGLGGVIGAATCCKKEQATDAPLAKKEEPVQAKPEKTAEKQQIRSGPGANSDVIDTGNPPLRQPADADLARLIDAWPTLPKAIRAGMLAMIDASATIPETA